ncbi:MAG TPA: phosphoglycolate phosphatase [Geminicoccaceae bacterium]|nr:phosphoglycolate phosphatase [Geminicoccus sp.]HMU48757.1 phosphoglycolate phosphatase [Geminicoccaceae bacterium]
MQETSRVRAIVFDLDGTLVDSAPDLLAAVNRLLAALGRSRLDLVAVKGMIGDGVRRLVERALAATGGVPPGRALDDAVEQFYAFYMQAPSVLTRAYPGVPNALEELHRRGIVLGVCTNKPAQAAQAILQELGLSRFLSGLSGGDSAGVRKPDPGHVLDAVARINGEAATTVMVGDNEHDIHAGKAAGLLMTIAVTHGYAHVPHEQLGADRLIDGFDELVPVLEEAGLLRRIL